MLSSISILKHLSNFVIKEKSRSYFFRRLLVIVNNIHCIECVYELELFISCTVLSQSCYWSFGHFEKAQAVLRRTDEKISLFWIKLIPCTYAVVFCYGCTVSAGFINNYKCHANEFISRDVRFFQRPIGKLLVASDD